MQRFYSYVYSVCFGFFLLPFPVWARDYGFSTSLTSIYSDNPLKASSAVISERQDLVQMSVFAKKNTETYDVDAHYSASYYDFAKDSQPERTTLLGAGKLTIGNPSDRLNALVSYERRELFGQPDTNQLLMNTDEQSIFTFEPTAHLRLSSVDLLNVFAQFSSVDYRLNEIQNTHREGFGMSLEHRLSVADNLTVDLNQSRVKFDAYNALEYDYSKASLGYQTTLRHLKYDFAVGVNKTASPVFGDHSGNYYQGQASYTVGGNQWLGSVNQSVTDTSMGLNGSTGSGTGLLGGGGGSISGAVATGFGEGFDNIEQTTFQVVWSTTHLCEKCVMTLGYVSAEGDYLSQPVSVRQRSSQWGLSYSLSRLQQISIKANQISLDYFLPSETRAKDGLTTEFVYTRSFTSNTSLAIRIKTESRDAKPSSLSYEENLVSLTLSKSF